MFHSILAPLSAVSATGLTASAEHAASGSDFALVLAVLFFALVLLVALVALMLVSQWKIYRKAGESGWASLVPFYNIAVLLRIVKKPVWWLVLLMFVPVVNLVLLLIVMRRLAASFGRGRWFTVGMVFLPFIFYPILAFGEATYTSIYPEPLPATEAIKWSLATAMLFCLFEFAFFSSAFSSVGSSAPLTVLSSDYGYATDGRYVYKNDVPIHGADAGSFEVKENGYATDYHAVYYFGDRIPGADPDTFSLIGDGAYAKDASFVYDGKDIVAQADPATFTHIANTGYAKDATHVFDGVSVIPGADVATFQSLDSGYSKDANHVYYYSSDGEGDTQVIGADPETFKAVDDPTGDYRFDAKDKRAHYRMGEEVSV